MVKAGPKDLFERFRAFHREGGCQPYVDACILCQIEADLKKKHREIEGLRVERSRLRVGLKKVTLSDHPFDVAWEVLNGP